MAPKLSAPAAGQLMHLDCPLLVRTGNEVSARRERQGIGSTGVRIDPPQFAGDNVPDPNRSVLAHGREQLSVRREGDIDPLELLSDAKDVSGDTFSFCLKCDVA